MSYPALVVATIVVAPFVPTTWISLLLGVRDE